jgi:hypothetical protein
MIYMALALMNMKNLLVTHGWMVLFIFGISEFMHHVSVPPEYENFSSKNRGFSDEPHETKL